MNTEATARWKEVSSNGADEGSPQVEGSVDGRSVFRDDYAASLRAASKGRDSENGGDPRYSTMNDPQPQRNSRMSLNSTSDDYGVSDLAIKPSNATPFIRQPSSPFGLFKAKIQGKQQEANVKKIKQAYEPHIRRSPARQESNPPQVKAYDEISKSQQASVNAVRSMFIDGPSKKITQIDGSATIAHALQNWESQYSNWEGLTTYYLRRFEENAEEVGATLKEQMARQMMALSTAGSNLSKAVVELQQLHAVEETEIRAQSSMIRDEQERNAKVHKDLEQALGQELVNAKKTELVITQLRKQVQESQLEQLTYKKKCDSLEMDIQVFRTELVKFKRHAAADKAEVQKNLAQEADKSRVLENKVLDAQAQVREMKGVMNQQQEEYHRKLKERNLQATTTEYELENQLREFKAEHSRALDRAANIETELTKTFVEERRRIEQDTDQAMKVLKFEIYVLEEKLAKADAALKGTVDTAANSKREIKHLYNDLKLSRHKISRLRLDIQARDEDREIEMECLAQRKSFQFGNSRFVPVPLLSKEVQIFEAIQHPLVPEGWKPVWKEDKKSHHYLNMITNETQETLPTSIATSTTPTPTEAQRPIEAQMSLETQTPAKTQVLAKTKSSRRKKKVSDDHKEVLIGSSSSGK